MYRVLLFIFWLGSLSAQVPAYLHYAVSDGLPGNLVYCGLEDHRGLLWFGTDKGLACFDGQRFRTYGVNDGLPDPEVLDMKEDSRGRIWLFCFSQRPCYLLDGRIITAKEDPQLEKIGLNSGTYTFSEVYPGDAWFTGRSREVYRLLNDSIFTHPLSEAPVGIFNVNGDCLIAGPADIFKIDRENRMVHLIKILADFDMVITPVVSCGVSGNRILYAFPNFMMLFEWKNGQMRKIAQIKENSGKVYVDHLGRFWTCSAGFGAICFDNPYKDLSNPVSYLAGQKVTTVFEDRQGTFWFETIANGVFALPKNTPISYFKAENKEVKNIRSVARMPDGEILAGDDAGNMHIISGKSIRTVHLGTRDGYSLIREIIPANQERVYVASDEGAYEYNWKTRTTRQFFNTQSVKSILVRGNKLWYGTHGMLGFLQLGDAGSGTILVHRRFTALGSDAQHNIWAGGIGGLASEQDTFRVNYGDLFPLLKSRIMGIRPAGERQLWVATAGNDLILADVRDGKITGVEAMNKRLSKPIFNIQSMFVEPNGRVWLATNRGVYGLDKDKQVFHLDVHDGLANDDVTAVLVHQDTLWAATVTGLSQIILRTPNELANFATLITNLHYQIGKEEKQLRLLDSLGERHPIELPPDVSSLVFDLTGLDFVSGRNLHFEIIQTNRLLPVQWWTFDNLVSWIGNGFQGSRDTTLVESASLSLGTYLPPGRYQFDCTAIKPSGVRSLRPDTWTLIKKPYWYESLWFYLSIWCALGYGVWRMYRARMAFREVLNTASVLQLHALQSQMNPHFIGNTVNAIQQFLHPPNPEKTSEYISIFMRLLRRTMDFSEQAFIPFEEELTYDQEYLQLVQLRFENKFRYQISGDEAVPPDTPIPSMLLQPVLENATIHGIAPEGISTLNLEFFYKPNEFCCILTDNGIGLNASQRQKQLFGMERKSKGLSLLHKKVETLNRLYDLDLKLSVQDLSSQQSSQQGTRVMLTYDPQKIWKAIKNRSAPALLFGE